MASLLGIDDTIPLICTILATDNSSGHVVKSLVLCFFFIRDIFVIN
jgi:hypothetical protein